MSDYVSEDTARKAFNAALAKAQAQIEGAARSSVNPHFKSKYADLSSAWDACREALTNNGFSVMQFPDFDGDLVHVETILAHAEGFERSRVCRLPVAKKDAQGVGSAITYARRYSLMAAIGIAPEDDDGNAAVSAQPASRERLGPEEWGENRGRDLSKLIKGDKADKKNKIVEEMLADIEASDSLDALNIWYAENSAKIDALSETEKNRVRPSYAAKLHDLKTNTGELTYAAE